MSYNHLKVLPEINQECLLYQEVLHWQTIIYNNCWLRSLATEANAFLSDKETGIKWEVGLKQLLQKLAEEGKKELAAEMDTLDRLRGGRRKSDESSNDESDRKKSRSDRRSKRRRSSSGKGKRRNLPEKASPKANQLV